jgi:hypothetical protein
MDIIILGQLHSQTYRLHGQSVCMAEVWRLAVHMSAAAISMALPAMAKAICMATWRDLGADIMQVFADHLDWYLAHQRMNTVQGKKAD